MKKAKKEAVEFLLLAAKESLVSAVRVANGGKNPVGKDLAELMAAWGVISEVTTGIRAPAELAMCADLMGIDQAMLADKLADGYSKRSHATAMRLQLARQGATA